MPISGANKEGLISLPYLNVHSFLMLLIVTKECSGRREEQYGAYTFEGWCPGPAGRRHCTAMHMVVVDCVGVPEDKFLAGMGI